MKILLPILLCLLLGGARAEIVVKDDRGVAVRLAAPAQRIVSLAPHITEVLFAAGAGSRIVGTVEYSDYPEAAQKIRRVGGYSRLDLEAIAALKPDLVIGWQSGNAATHMDKLEKLGLTTFVSQPDRIEDIAATLESYGRLAGTGAVAQPAAQAFRERLAALRARYAKREPLRVFYPIWRKPWMSVNRETYIHDVLRMAGAENVCADFDCRYPEIPLEWLLSRKVEAVLLPSEPWAWTASDRSALESERTLGSARIGLCDGRDFCWHGVRAADGLGNATRIVSALQRSRPPGD